MDKNTRRTIIIGSIVVLLIVPVVTVLLISKTQKDTSSSTSQQQTAPTDRSNADLTTAILKGTSDLSNSDGKPNFTIASVKKPSKGWYVLTLYTLSDTEKTNPAKVLLYDSGRDGLMFIMGPGTSFSEDQIQAKGVPTIVAQELNK